MKPNYAWAQPVDPNDKEIKVGYETVPSERAMDSLDRAVAVRSALLPSIINDAKLDAVRDGQRFKEVVQKIGFKPTLN